MILIVFVAAGLLAGVLRAIIKKATYKVPKLRNAWLLVIALALQGMAFSIPFFRDKIPIDLVKIMQILSLCSLQIFAVSNLGFPGFGILALGILFNLLVISLNGGLMPISPEVITHIFHGQPPGLIQVGQRFGFGKDIVLAQNQTILWFLSDCLTLPGSFQYQVAFSAGDVFIGAGVFWLLFNIPELKEGELKWYSIFRQKYLNVQLQKLTEARK